MDGRRDTPVPVLYHQDAAEMSIAQTTFSPDDESQSTYSMPSAAVAELLFIFEVTALDSDTVDTVKDKLRTRLEGLVQTERVNSEVIKIMGTQAEGEIKALESPDVSINIGNLDDETCKM